MKIGVMSLWNAANGPSVHAELLVREWVRMGHKVRVFSAIRHPDARRVDAVDEEYVYRHFSVDSVRPVTRAKYFDPTPLLEEDYEIFMAENVERLPTEKLVELFPKIRRKAKTVAVIHEGVRPVDENFYRLEWDAVVMFDERYLKLFSDVFPREKVWIIPFPCHPLKLGDAERARKELALPPDKKIVFSFGFHPREQVEVLPALSALSRRVEMTYLLLVNPDSEKGDVEYLMKRAGRYGFTEVRFEAPPRDRLYRYLHASDAHLIYRKSKRGFIVLSSTICLTIGSGCPIVVNDSNFVEMHGDEVIKYGDFDDLAKKLMGLFRGGFDLTPVRRFLSERGADVIAKRYIEMFREVLS